MLLNLKLTILRCVFLALGLPPSQPVGVPSHPSAAPPVSTGGGGLDRWFGHLAQTQSSMPALPQGAHVTMVAQSPYSYQQQQQPPQQQRR